MFVYVCLNRYQRKGIAKDQTIYVLKDDHPSWNIFYDIGCCSGQRFCFSLPNESGMHLSTESWWNNRDKLSNEEWLHVYHEYSTKPIYKSTCLFSYEHSALLRYSCKDLFC